MNELRSKSLADVVVGAHDGVVSSGHLRGLEQRVNHTLPSGDVLLVIRHVLYQMSPSVLLRLLLLICVFSRRRRNLEVPRKLRERRPHSYFLPEES